jgi:hypothetical protein
MDSDPSSRWTRFPRPTHATTRQCDYQDREGYVCTLDRDHAEDHAGWADRLRGAPVRDPARIPVLLDALRAAWEQSPDLRLTQLLVNLLDARPNPIFSVEDDVVLARLRATLRPPETP